MGHLQALAHLGLVLSGSITDFLLPLSLTGAVLLGIPVLFGTESYS